MCQKQQGSGWSLFACPPWDYWVLFWQHTVGVNVSELLFVSTDGHKKKMQILRKQRNIQKSQMFKHDF